MRYLLPATNSCQLTGTRRARRSSLCSGRAGVSLVEVMFSIGVAMIGLVGIAALLPVAGAQANKGALADAAARLGADAIREFHVRSMGNPSTWRWFEGSQFRPVRQDELAAGISFCLDPRFVAQGNDDAGRSQFPYIAPGTVLSMPRITLTPSPGATLPLTAVMLPPRANQVFTSDDSLVFDLPQDRTLGPVQNFSLSPTAPYPPLRRNTNGYFSWLATIVPKLDRMGNLTDEYTLSVVVFSRRIIDAALTNENLASERVVVVGNFYSGQPAIGGGDLRLATRRNYADDLQLRSGDWVMLSGTEPRTGTLAPIQVHKWYRVANAGEEAVLGSPGVWVRDVTLVGPDWNWQNNPTTQVTIARGAVAVFEKTIRLETSSLWTY
jgi:hypothetical protein